MTVEHSDEETARQQPLHMFYTRALQDIQQNKPV